MYYIYGIAPDAPNAPPRTVRQYPCKVHVFTYPTRHSLTLDPADGRADALLYTCNIYGIALDSLNAPPRTVRPYPCKVHVFTYPARHSLTLDPADGRTDALLYTCNTYGIAFDSLNAPPPDGAPRSMSSSCVYTPDSK